MDDISRQLGEIIQWQKDYADSDRAWKEAHERHDDSRFLSMGDLMKNMPTKDDLGTLADKEDIARLNGIVHNFLLGITITQKLGKWGFRAVVFVGGVVGGILVLKGWFIAVLAWFGVAFTHVK